MTDQYHYFHLHLVSDSTGETLIAASRAVASQYENTRPIEHVHPMTCSREGLENVLAEIDDKPGIVLFTIADEDHARLLIDRCSKMGMPCVSVLEPIFQTFRSYLGVPSTPRSGAQHELNSEYFSRIDAINFSLMHDDGSIPGDIDEADILLLGISRTSKTPTALYLANRGLKVANIPLVLGIDLPRELMDAKKPLTIALIASTDRIVQVRQNRDLGELDRSKHSNYVDRAAVSAELAWTRRLCAKNSWPMIDVSRKSIEETAAKIYALWQEHCARKNLIFPSNRIDN